MPALIEITDAGLYCARGDFYVDPWKPVPMAVITHAHSDHARFGCDSYLAAQEGHGVLAARLGAAATIAPIAWGEPLIHNGVRISLHPAGHILGSAQVRLEHQGEVWAVSGDYKLEPDSTSRAFEPVRCHTFISESTFGLPIYRWPSPTSVFQQINAWWRSNRDVGRASLLFGYSLGKAQRLLSGLDPSIGLIYTHGAVEAMSAIYRQSGVALPATIHAGSVPASKFAPGCLVVGPPSAHGSVWARKFGPSSSAFASGWMRIRGARRRQSVDRGFVLSDHADWPGLLAAIEATGAQRVLCTHGYSAVMARRLVEKGLDASTLATQFEGERDDSPAEPAETAS
jgi:putative mRNA 3-end processing factor